MHRLVIRSVVSEPEDEQEANEIGVPPAERPRSAEEELARGQVEQTPFSVISWVAVALGLLAAVALVLVVVAYVIA
jgi:hypothetical protein